MNNVSSIISNEDNLVTSTYSKIGLMYVSDYYYAYNGTGQKNCLTGSGGCLNWMYDSRACSWTMSRHGIYSSGGHLAWRINMDGSVNHGHYDTTQAHLIFPVFYLNSNTGYLDNGNGSQSSPFELMPQ